MSRVLVIIVALLWPAQLRAGQHTPRSLIAAATSKQLARHVTWLRLGHWRSHDGGFKSEADGAGLFLARNGKHSPDAELRASIIALYQPADGHADTHAQCRFPARAIWLQSKLQAPLPAVECPAYQAFLARLNAQTISFVFASHYSGRLASMVGHTFLVARNQSRPELLDVVIDYGASVTTDHFLAYTWNGLTGGFQGGFSITPFYRKVIEYNRQEGRDLVEYRMALSERQLAMFLAHLWELRQTYFGYKFLTENCVYHAIGALDVADPRWTLLAGLSFPAFPIDAIKALVRVPGLVTDVKWWPSALTRFKTSRLSAADLDLAEALVADPATPFPDHMPAAHQARILDAAIDLFSIRYRDDQRLAKRSRLMSRRARNTAPPQAPVLSSLGRPDRGHGPRRVRLGAEFSDDSNLALTAEFRLSFHDLLDPIAGHPALSQLELLLVRFDARLPTAALRLRELWLGRMLVIEPRDRLSKELSYSFGIGAQRMTSCDCLVPAISGWLGMAWSWHRDRIATFGMLGGEVLLRRHIGAAGALGGVRLRLHPSLLFLVSGRFLVVPRPTVAGMHDLSAMLRWGITRDVGVDLGWRNDSGGNRGEMSLVLYF